MCFSKKDIKNLLAITIVLSTTNISALAINAGNLAGPTSNSDIFHDKTMIKTDLNTNMNRGTVGQTDWNTFSPAKNAKVDFGFSAMQQSLINRVDGSDNTNINNILKPANGTYTTSQIIYNDLAEKTDNSNITYERNTSPKNDLGSKTSGTVGQTDWNTFSPAKNAKVDFKFSAVPQKTIELINNSKSQIIIEPQN